MMRILLVFFLFLFSSCNKDSCSCSPDKFEWVAQNNGNCLYGLKGDRILLTTANKGVPILHPENGNYSEPTVSKENDSCYLHYFEPINDLRIFHLSGIKRTFSQKYSVQMGHNEFLFTIDTKHYLDSLKLIRSFVPLRPQWNNGIINRKFIDNQWSINSTNYELAVAGLNIILLPYISENSLVMEIRIINHSMNNVFFRKPKSIQNDIIKITDTSELIKPGEKLGEKYHFNVSSEGPLFLDKRFIKTILHSDTILYFRENIRIDMDEDLYNSIYE